ncbi:MAG: SUMF1/EgtB/PvdO family nonheme iron enzyme [Chloroflexi bacterium]|nr:SUMF1/EgtB/PvdO family nonheme iron enzyme [Chloroflexota bacterium]
MSKKPTFPKKRTPTKRGSSTPTIGTMKGGTAARDIYCADFVGGNQRITYGYSAREVERLIEKVLAFLQAGATFLPSGDTVRAELDGESLTFQPDAITKLARQRSERSYLLALIVHREYRDWATKFIPLAAQMDKITEMPIAFSEFRIPSPGAGPEARLETVPLADITEALAKHSAFVILGEPGAGKTTTLQKIAFEAARKLLSGEPGPVPLFVRLSMQAERTPFDFLETEWRQRTGSDLADALSAGRVLLLADGINELPLGPERDKRLKAWRLFLNEYCESSQVVFTSREKDYDQQLNLPRVRVEPLDDARITDYLQRNDAQGLAAYLDDPRSRLREMAGNPFNLWLLTLKYKDNQTGMENRGQLLDWFVQSLLKREKDQAHSDWIHRRVQMTALAQLAYQMQKQGQGLTFPFKIAEAALPTTVDLAGEDIPIRPLTLFRLARAATILDPGIDPDIRFYHHLLQEYFAALELRRRFDASEDLGALWKCKRLASEMPAAQVGDWDPLPEPPATGWEVTTILACGLAHAPARLIEAVRPHNPVLAGRMLDEAGMAKPDAVTKLVRADLLADLYDPAVHLRARLQAGFALGRIGDPRFEPQMLNGVKVIVPTMVRVPAGKYVIGDDASQYDDEKPQHEIELPAFEIGKWSVTNAEYACFIDASGYKDERYWKTDLAKRWLRGEDVTGGQFASWLRLWKALQETPNWKEQLERTGSYSPEQLKTYEQVAGLSEEELKTELGKSLSNKSREQPQWWNDAQYNNPAQPVVGITWFEANAYCAWLSEMTAREYRLPSEVEWEAAACGLPSPSQGEGLGMRVRTYPWGDDWDAACANTIEGRVMRPSPVGAYRAAGGVGECGAEDQSGNTWDWMSTQYRDYPYQAEDRENPEAEGERVVRGGSWLNVAFAARWAIRDRLVPDNFTNNLGFRLCSPGSIPAS